MEEERHWNERDWNEPRNSIEVIDEILIVRGWEYLLAYLKRMADQEEDQPKLQKAIRDAMEIAKEADERLFNRNRQRQS